MREPIQDTIAKMTALPAIQQALTLLREKLPQTLTYHAYSHIEDVLKESLRLALADNLSARDTELLAVAAAWHDVGFIESIQNNEPLAVAAMRRCRAVLESYSLDEIALIERMILDTALLPYNGSFRQVASTPLSRYLLDGDLANFGRDDFFEKSELLRRELGEEEFSFRRKTLLLVENHVWLTPAATRLWGARKEQNLAELRKRIAHDATRE